MIQKKLNKKVNVSNTMSHEENIYNNDDNIYTQWAQTRFKNVF